MRHRQYSLFLACGLFVAAALPAAAQERPIMTGTWKGTGYGVQIGPTPYRPIEGPGVQFPENGIEFTYVLKEQHDNRFSGEMTSGKFKETIIGAIQADNRSGVMLDNDGQYFFTLIDPSTMDVCYNHHNPTSKFVGCFRLFKSR